MTSLDDLRETLALRADDVVRGDETVRRAAVHHRVGVVRRRRRVATVGAVAAVVATAGTVALLPQSSDRAIQPARTPVVVGVPAPSTLTALGFDYDFARGYAGSGGRVEIDLEPSDVPRLVSWGTSGADDRVTVDAGVRRTYLGGDFDNWVEVPAGEEPTQVVARVAEGTPGLAVYTLGDKRPDGVTAYGSTFPGLRPGGGLLAGEFTAGRADLTLRATATGPGYATNVVCAGLDDEDLYLHEQTVGDPGASGGTTSCTGPLPTDATRLDETGRATAPGNDLTTRFWITRGEDGPVVDDPRLRFGVAIYALDADPVAPLEMAPEVDAEGHTWGLIEVRRLAAGEGLEYRNRADADERLVVAEWRTRGEVQLLLDEDGEKSRRYAGIGVRPTVEGVVGSGGHVTATPEDGTRGNLGAGAVGIYKRMD